MLSQWIRVGSLCVYPISDSNVHSHIASLVAWSVATYSASVEELATVACFLDDHDIAPLPRLKEYPEMDFRSSMSCAKSESTCPLRMIGSFPPVSTSGYVFHVNSK